MARAAGTLLGQKLGRSKQETDALVDLLMRAELTTPGDADLHQAIKEAIETSTAILTDLEITKIIELARSQAMQPPFRDTTLQQP